MRFLETVKKIDFSFIREIVKSSGFIFSLAGGLILLAGITIGYRMDKGNNEITHDSHLAKNTSHGNQKEGIGVDSSSTFVPISQSKAKDKPLW